MIKKANSKVFLNARVTYLEMNARNTHFFATPSHGQLALMRAHEMPLHFYRYLYEQVGRPHHWAVRRDMDDETLRSLVHAKTTIIHILYVDGCPAGFAETNFADMPKSAEIIYFGLIPDYQGRGFSRFFFHEVLASIWDKEPEKVIIQTNTLDNPRALQLYQKAGFEPVSFRDAMVERWD